MGLLGKLKSMKNAVTGGAATVSVEMDPIVRGEEAQVRIHAAAKADLNVKSVYLLIRATERAELRDTDIEDGQIEREWVRGHKVVFDHRFDIAGPQQVAEGEEGVWEGSFSIPESANPTVHGTMIQNTWEVQAGLDMVGNDPDSGWQEVEVS